MIRDRSPKNRGDENDSAVQKLTDIPQHIGPDQGISPMLCRDTSEKKAPSFVTITGPDQKSFPYERSPLMTWLRNSLRCSRGGEDYVATE
jgi:hypothetical protein